VVTLPLALTQFLSELNWNMSCSAFCWLLAWHTLQPPTHWAFFSTFCMSNSVPVLIFLEVY
jgi:hypothetical protein